MLAHSLSRMYSNVETAWQQALGTYCCTGITYKFVYIDSVHVYFISVHRNHLIIIVERWRYFRIIISLDIIRLQVCGYKLKE